MNCIHDFHGGFCCGDHLNLNLWPLLDSNLKYYGLMFVPVELHMTDRYITCRKIWQHWNSLNYVWSITGDFKNSVDSVVISCFVVVIL